MTVPDEPKSVAFWVDGAIGTTFRNVTVIGGDVGIYARGVSDLKVEGFKYRGAGQAFDIEGQSAKITGTRITSDRSQKGKSHIGYVKPNGPPLPAQCPDCKSIFPSRHYNLALPRFLSGDNKETCQVCGLPNASLAEGLFSLVGEFVQVIEADENSMALMKAIGAVAASISATVSEGEIDAAIEKIAEASPNAAKLLKASPWTTVSAIFIAFAALMAGLNDGYDVFYKYKVSEKVAAIFETMSEVTIQSVEALEGKYDSPQAHEGRRVATNGEGKIREHCDRLNNSTAIPTDLPIPSPRPKSP